MVRAMNNKTLSLEMFCDPERPELARPFSIDAWTYASNGHILVRVPRRDDVGECKGDFAAKVLALMSAAASRKPRYSPAPKFELPESFEREEDCFDCSGTGKAHNCPACQCVCAANA